MSRKIHIREGKFTNELTIKKLFTITVHSYAGKKTLLKSELKNWSTGLNLYLKSDKFLDIIT